MLDNYDNERIKLEKAVTKKLKILAEIASVFECKRCGKCCVDASPELYYQETMHFRNEKLIWLEKFKGYAFTRPCPFYIFNKGKSDCKTQNYKPISCKIYPFSLGHEELGMLSIILCPLGADIYNLYTAYCKENGINIKIDKIKGLYDNEGLTNELKDEINKILKEFSGGKADIREIMENTIGVGIQLAFPIDFDNMEGFKKFIYKREYDKNYKAAKKEASLNGLKIMGYVETKQRF